MNNMTAEANMTEDEVWSKFMEFYGKKRMSNLEQA
jgi:hypothetical protein